MAISFTEDMYYTRSGEAAESDVLSAHDALIWEFNDEYSAGPATATVQIVVKNNAGATIYTSDLFTAYLYDTVADVPNEAYFRFDATEIIRHIINTYFYKETASILEPENYGSEIEVTFKTYDNAVLQNTTLNEYFASHAVNQIGDEDGANIPRIFYRDTEEIAHFLGFPNHLFFFAPLTLAAHDPFIEIIDSSTDAITNLISTLSNSTYNTFTVVGTSVTSAEAIDDGAAYSGVFPIVKGKSYAVIIPDFTLTDNQYPTFSIKVSLVPSQVVRITDDGDTILILTAQETGANGRLCIENDDDAEWNCGTISVFEVIAASGEGTFGLYMHDYNLSYFQLDNTAKTVNIYYDPADPTLIKTFNLTVFDPCENAVYVRFLTSDGHYMFWAFSPFPTTSQEHQDIGRVINSFSSQADANSRYYPIGKKNAFKKLLVAAATVPIAFRRKLMDIFTSPAVYVWQGTETPDENLITGLINVGASPYETFTSSGIVVISAINTAANANAYSIAADNFETIKGDVIIVIFELNLNSGTAPTISLVNEASGALSSNAVVSANGHNEITLTSISDVTARLRFYNTAASNFSTGKIIVKRKELEADWILLEGVEGSHQLREKKQFDNLECTLVYPEKYTQKLAGQNL